MKMLRWLLFFALPAACLSQTGLAPSHTGALAGAVAGCINSPVCPCVVVGSQQREFCTSSVTWHGVTNGANITVEAIGGGGGGDLDITGGCCIQGGAGGGSGFASHGVGVTRGGNGAQGIVVITYTP
jgi:hypothetical protein